MRTATVNVYKFSELSDKAKEAARSWLRNCEPCDISDELHSITAFCTHWGVKLTDYSVGAWSMYDYKHNATNSNFRGVKLRDIDRDAMPTGYYLDCTLWMTFHDRFKATGDALRAFDDALDRAFYDTRAEMEGRESDEYLDELMEGNEYEFTESGEFYR